MAGDGIGLENRRGLIAPCEFDPHTFRQISMRGREVVSLGTHYPTTQVRILPPLRE